MPTWPNVVRNVKRAANIDPIVSKHAHVHDFDVQAAVEDIEWQQRNYKTRAAPQQQQQADGDENRFVTAQDLYLLVDIIGEESGKVHKELLDKIAALENELHLVKALAKGEIAALIEDKRNVKTAS